MRCSSSAPVCGIADDELASCRGRCRAISTTPSILAISAASFGTARLEEFGHARQTAGDVLGLGDLARGLGQTLSGLDLRVLLHFDVRAGGNRSRRR